MTNSSDAGLERTVDVIVAGSGAAALTAALTAAVAGLKVLVLEKSALLGGTSAMSGAGIWVPANHLAAAAGFQDSRQEALAYLRNASPAGWRDTEDPLWQRFAEDAPTMLAFVERHTPLRFSLTNEPDPMAEHEGGKLEGRMVSPNLLGRRIVGRYARRLRSSTMPHLFTYNEMRSTGIYTRPVRGIVGMLPKLLWRALTRRAGQGSALITGLLKGCLDHGCRIETSARVLDLLVDDASARITGVRVQRGGEQLDYHARRGVVLATGGFEWDEALRQAHFPGPLDRLGSPRSNEGDGQRMAQRVGARLDRMDQANVYPTLPTVYEGKPHGLPFPFQAFAHAIVVDRHGRRFVSESDYNIGEQLDRRHADGSPVHLPAYVVADARFMKHSLPFRWFARKQRGWVHSAPTLAELAARLGLPAQSLQDTVSRFNGFCAQGKDLDFARGESVWERFQSGGKVNWGSVERGPFFGMSINRSILGTKGGARTDAGGRVLRPDGSVIEGLYCAGNAMANPIGTRAVGAGTTIGPCMTWGFVCARTISGA
ncbi:FAD-dependent oxidoreductase [Variovorax sp. M-6]|uniref:FAD-dependent oxidoreductase n=1 Tax=Variovorax sp. M-6 TaxID=3233041 RepID=UPI003F9AAC79